MLLAATGAAACVVPSSGPRAPSACVVMFRSEAIIAAPTSRVWAVLTDLSGYRTWNPWLNDAAGELRPGGEVRVHVRLNGALRPADHVVLAVDRERRLCWRDAGWTTLFVYGQRCRWLEVLPDGRVHFRQELQLEGAMAPLARAMYGGSLQAGMDAETEALRQSSEAAEAAAAAR
jgi:uncharacterized protein YndB with AHSA1/START domain